jgi:hypothetical protein
MCNLKRNYFEIMSDSKKEHQAVGLMGDGVVER